MEKGREILQMRRIRKNFPGVRALNGVDFTLRSGEIHALLGENGAGKSTLIKVLTGAEEFESGKIILAGKPIINASPQKAQNNGISAVYQEINLCPNISVAENLYISREPMKKGMIDWKTMNRNAEEAFNKLDIHLDVTLTLNHYSVAIQQMVAIVRAVDISSKVLILDEPTSSLDDNEVNKLFSIMRKLKEDGLGIIFVTHYIDQVYEICDKITVLRNGELIGEYEVENLPRLQLVAKMMGKELDYLAAVKHANPACVGKNAEAIIEANNLGCKGKVKSFDVIVNKGDVIGLCGLLGSGRSELARTIYGAEKPDSGELKVKGKKLKMHAPVEAMKAGMAFLPENRKEEGIIPDLSVRENIIIALQVLKGTFKLMDRKEQEEFTDKYIDLLKIKTADRETPVKQLSGGNQQKIILARWLLTNPDFLILDEPTRGIDVGTKTEIQRLVVNLSEEGKTVMFISSEIEEMLRTCSRMIVMRDASKAGELSGEEITQVNIMKSIAGGAVHEKTGRFL